MQPPSTSTSLRQMPETGSDRDALIDTAELLFASRGINGPSLREVTQVAGVRNKSAVQYHFGDRGGLVRAVLARRGETLRVRRALSLEQLLVNGTEHRLRSLCRAIIEPYCEFLGDGSGALSYLIVANEVLGDPTRSYDELQADFNDPLLPELIMRLVAEMDLPETIAAERTLVAMSSVIGSVADRARRQLDRTAIRPLAPVDLFVANLVDMLAAAVSAPADQATLDAAHPTRNNPRSATAAG